MLVFLKLQSRPLVGDGTTLKLPCGEMQDTVPFSGVQLSKVFDVKKHCTTCYPIKNFTEKVDT